MEPKKSPKADLQNKRSLFLEIGLFISIGLMILAFNYSQTTQVVEAIDTQIVAVEEQIVEITREPPKQSAPRANIQFQSDVLKIVKDDIKIEVDPKFNELDEDRPLIIPDGTNGDGSDGGDIGEEIFVVTDAMPQFQGGDLEKFHAWVSTQIGSNYPSEAKRRGIQGTVIASFVIEKDGKLSQVEILTSPDPILSNAVIEVLKRSPRWTPGKQGRHNARVRMNIPVQFMLN